MNQIQLVGNSLPIIVADGASLPTGIGFTETLIRSDSPVYMRHLAKEHSLTYFSQSNTPIIACSSLLKSWAAYTNDVIIVHAGCAELVPVDRQANLGWLRSIYDHLDPYLPDSIYFSETINRYIDKVGNEAYLTEDEFLLSCVIAWKSLSYIWWARKIVVGICYMAKEDWRFSYMATANRIMKEVFPSFCYIDLFSESLSHLVGEDGIHLTAEGHLYVYDSIKERFDL